MRLIKAFLIGNTVLFLAVCVVYWFDMRRDDNDAPAVGIGNMAAAENSQEPFYYKLNDSLFARVKSRGGKNVVESIGTYTEYRTIPYCLVCGSSQYDQNGTFISDPGETVHYYYDRYPRTFWFGQEHTSEEYLALNKTTWKWLILDKSGYNELLSSDGASEDLQMDGTGITGNYPKLTMRKESCFVILNAFFTVYFLLLLFLAIGYTLKRMKNARGELRD